MQTYPNSFVDIDFESRSEADIMQVGAYKYAAHPSTEILMISFSINQVDVYNWNPFFPIKRNLRLLKRGIRLVTNNKAVFRAHNSEFEYWMWNLVAVRQFGWPVLELKHFYDTMVVACIAGFPASLENAGFAIGGNEQKDKGGKALINFFSKPSRKADEKYKDPLIYKTKFFDFIDYCDQDVRSQIDIANATPPMTKRQWQVFQLTEKMNKRGLPIDKDMAAGALKCVDIYKKRADKEIQKLTKGVIESATQNIKLTEWLNTHGCDIPNMQAATIEKYLRKKLPNKIKRAIQLRSAVSKSSTSKYKAALVHLSDNNTVHGFIKAFIARCVPGDTEVLTEKGWISLYQWDEKEKIAQYTPETSDIEFLPAEKYIGPIEDKWVQVNAPYLKVEMTEGHSIPELHYTSKQFKKSKAGELLLTKSKKLHLTSGNLIYNTNNFSINQTKFCVMMQADGNICKDIIRLTFKKSRKIKRCISILNGCNIPFYINSYNYATSIIIRKKHCKPWMYKSKYFGKWLLKLSPNNKKIFLSELKYWDGQYEKNIDGLASSILENVKWVQIIAHLSSKRTNGIKKGIDKRNGSIIYYTTILKKTNNYCCIKPNHTIKINKPQRTYCTKTKTGWWVARSKGHVFITGNTGRWGGRGLQIQNFSKPRNGFPYWTDYNILAQAIAEADIWFIELIYDDIMESLKAATRSMIHAPKGLKFICADYAQIEARIVMWIANDLTGLADFMGEGKIYESMAADIFLININKVQKPSFERDVGKEAVLGCGFGMGADKFVFRCVEQRNLPVTSEMGKKAVKGYRTRYKEVPKAWKQCEKAAINAISNPGHIFTACDGKLAYKKEGKFLIVQLPSNRKLYYPYPKIVLEVKWGNECEVVYYKNWNNLAHVGHKWQYESIWGGTLFQHAVQATAMDIMANGMLNAEKKGYPALFTVHDESLAMVKENFGTVKEYEDILCQLEPWAKGLPIVAEGWEGNRYKK